MLPNLAALRLTPTGANDGEASSPDSKRQKVDEEGEGGEGSGSAEVSIIDGLAIEEVINRDAAVLDAQGNGGDDDGKFSEEKGEEEEVKWQPEHPSRPKPFESDSEMPPAEWLEKCRNAYRVEDFVTKATGKEGSQMWEEDAERWDKDDERWGEKGEAKRLPTNLYRNAKRQGRGGPFLWDQPKENSTDRYRWDSRQCLYVNQTGWRNFRTLEQALAAIYWTQKAAPEVKTYEQKEEALGLEAVFADCLKKEFDAMAGYDMHILNESTKADVLVRRSKDGNKWWQVQLKVANRWCKKKKWSFALSSGAYDGMVFLCHALEGPNDVPCSWFYDGALFGKGKYLAGNLTISAEKDERETKWTTVGWEPTRPGDWPKFNEKARGRLLRAKCNEVKPDRCKAAAQTLVKLLEHPANEGWLTFTTKEEAASNFASKSHAMEWEGLQFLMSKYGYEQPRKHQLPYDLEEKDGDGTVVKTFQVKSRSMQSIRKAWDEHRGDTGTTVKVAKHGSKTTGKEHVAYEAGDYDDLIFLLKDEQAGGWHEWRIANAPTTVMENKQSLRFHFPKGWVDNSSASGDPHVPPHGDFNSEAIKGATYKFTRTA